LWRSVALLCTVARCCCSGHTSATTWNSAKSEGTASGECAWCESRKSKCLDQKWRGKRFSGQIGKGADSDQLALITSSVGSSNGKRGKTGCSGSLHTSKSLSNTGRLAFAESFSRCCLIRLLSIPALLRSQVKAEVNRLYRLREIGINWVCKPVLLLKKKKYAALSVQNMFRPRFVDSATLFGPRPRYPRKEFSKFAFSHTMTSGSLEMNRGTVCAGLCLNQFVAFKITSHTLPPTLAFDAESPKVVLSG